MKRQKGFNIIELLIVIMILIVLSAILVPNFLAARQRGLERIRKEKLATVESRIKTIDGYIKQATIGNNTAYIPLIQEGEGIDNLGNPCLAENRDLAIKTLDRFQELYNVQILSWNFQALDGRYLEGLTVTFFKPEDKLSETQNSNQNSKIGEVDDK